MNYKVCFFIDYEVDKFVKLKNSSRDSSPTLDCPVLSRLAKSGSVKFNKG